MKLLDKPIKMVQTKNTKVASRASDSVTIVLAVVFFLCVNMRVMMMLTRSIPICHLRSHSLVCIKNRLFIVGIGPILNKYLEFIY